MDSMTKAFITDLISHDIVGNWVFWLLVFFVSGLSAIAASFIGGYGRKRGENMATKADFESLKEQLQATTRLTEEIKNEVGHIEWRTREEFTSRRKKLEEFAEQIGIVASTIDKWQSRALAEDYLLLETECMSHLEMLARLYFRILIHPTFEFITAWRNIIQYRIAAQQTYAKISPDDYQACQQAFQKYLEGHAPLYTKALEKRIALEETIVRTMGNILQFSNE